VGLFGPSRLRCLGSGRPVARRLTGAGGALGAPDGGEPPAPGSVPELPLPPPPAGGVGTPPSSLEVVAAPPCAPTAARPARRWLRPAPAAPLARPAPDRARISPSANSSAAVPSSLTIGLGGGGGSVLSAVRGGVPSSSVSEKPREAATTTPSATTPITMIRRRRSIASRRAEATDVVPVATEARAFPARRGPPAATRPIRARRRTRQPDSVAAG